MAVVSIVQVQPLVLFILLHVNLFGKLEANVLEVTPTPFIPGLTSDLTVTCLVQPMAVAVSQVFAIQLEKADLSGGHAIPLANVQSGRPPVLALASLGTRATLEGVLDNADLPSAYLKMTLTDPQHSDSGQYRCAITAEDRTANIHTLTFKVNTTSEDITSASQVTAVTALQNELKSLQRQVSDLKANCSGLGHRVLVLETDSNDTKTRLGTVEKKQVSVELELAKIRSEIDPLTMTCPVACADVIGHLGSRVNKTQVKVDSNTDALQRLQTSLHQQTNNHTKQVAFSARFKNTPTGVFTLKPPEQLVFDDVLVNEGNGYDVSHGTFVAPVSGNYVLFLNVPIREPDPNRVLHVALLDKTKTISQIENGSTKRLTSISVIYHLDAGDVVYAFISQISGQSSLPDPKVSVYAAYFAGFLLE